jgi:Mn-containing catalase
MPDIHETVVFLIHQEAEHTRLFGEAFLRLCQEGR